jgi:hypothetical protein
MTESKGHFIIGNREMREGETDRSAAVVTHGMTAQWVVRTDTRLTARTQISIPIKSSSCGCCGEPFLTSVG